MKIAVCDDCKIDQKKASAYILQYAENNMLNIQIDVFNNGSELLSAFQASAYKIVFLDIYMDGMSGVETAFKIREWDKDCMIIFTTTSPDHRADGFEVGAVHYLLKPLSYKEIEVALDRCKRLFVENERYIQITVDRHLTKVCLKDILYAEVYGKMVLIHTVREILKTYIPLTKIAILFGGSPFLQCNRSYLVNMHFITGVQEANFELENGERVPIRKNGRQKIKDQYTRYFLNSLRRSEDA